ncbi:hypothetical protein AMTRI_Chr13g88320 [Amborella trichopoda]
MTIRRISSAQQLRTQDKVVLSGNGGLICNPGQVQAKNLGNFLQSWHCLTCRKKESVRLIVKPFGKSFKSRKFTCQEAMFKMPIIEIEAKRAMISGHCLTERNQPRNHEPIIGKPLTRRGTSPDRRPCEI